MSIKIQVENEKEFQELKDKSVKVKIISFEKLNKNIFSRMDALNPREKKLLLKEIATIWTTWSDEEISEEFNSICCDRLFTSGVDISSYPVLDSVAPDYTAYTNGVECKECQI